MGYFGDEQNCEDRLQKTRQHEFIVEAFFTSQKSVSGESAKT